MKFLANNFYLVALFLFFNVFLASECIDIWYESNLSKIKNDFIAINARIYPSIKKKNLDSLKIYIDQINSRIRIESSKEILLFDKQKSIKLFKEEKQLYIDEPDSSMFVFLASILNLKNIEPIKNSNFKYRLKLGSNFNKTKLFFSEDCFSLESIYMVVDKVNIIIDNINFEPYDGIDSIDIFEIKGNYSRYDLRQ